MHIIEKKGGFCPFSSTVSKFVGFLFFACFMASCTGDQQQQGNLDHTSSEVDDDRIVNGIHVATGLVVAEGFEEVKAMCTQCHSAKLVTQNRASRAGWEEMIDWMQETQGLWELGENRSYNTRLFSHPLCP